MKTLAVLAIILGVLFLYFVATAEKSLVVKGGELVPGGIDIPKLILDKATKIKSLIVGDKNTKVVGDSAITDSEVITDSGSAFINKIKTDVGNLVSKTVDKISKSVKSPIENKINEFLCPTK